MKALLVGGTGIISTAVTELAVKRGWDVTLLNRGNAPAPPGARVLCADIADEEAARAALGKESFDVVAQFIVYTADQLERDIRLFDGRTRQYIFISTASAYQKPVSDWLITESTPLHNPYWRYSREKIACEELLLRAYRERGFPMTVARPSHTYSNRSLTVPLHGSKGAWQVLRRMLDGKPVIVPGDGTSLWTITHSDDFAAAFLGLMGHPKSIGQAYHITSDEQLTWDQAIAAIAAALGVEPRIAHISSEFLVACNPELEGPLLGDKCRSVVFDNAKIKRLVPGYTADTRFDQGARASVEYFLSHPEAQRHDPEFDAWCDRVIAAHEAGKKAFAQLK